MEIDTNTNKTMNIPEIEMKKTTKTVEFNLELNDTHFIPLKDESRDGREWRREALRRIFLNRLYGVRKEKRSQTYDTQAEIHSQTLPN